MIEPTVGRIVLFHPHVNDGGDPNGQPHAAIVTHVHHDRLINLTVFNENGSIYAKQNVQLVQDEDPFPTDGSYAEWMAYQKGQATKTDSVTVDLQKIDERFREVGDYLAIKFAEIEAKLDNPLIAQGAPPIVPGSSAAASPDPANPNAPAAS